MNYNNKTFEIKSRSLYGNKFRYAKVNYVNFNTKVCLYCTEKDENGVEHGEFWVTPNNHFHGNGGCKKCKSKSISDLKRMTTDEFIEKAKKIHGDDYDYSKTDLNNRDEKGRVCIICKKCGDEFWQRPNGHLRGCGCYSCSGVTLSSTDEFIEKAKKIHGDDYDYGGVNYINNRTPVKIICNKCGTSFLQTPHNHLAGQGCRKCSYEYRRLNSFDDNDAYIEKAEKIHNHKYDYSLLKKETYIDIICPKHGKFTQHRNDHLQGCGCPSCGNVLSKGEDEIFNFIKSVKSDVRQRDRKIIAPSEIDIFIPSMNIAFEYDGIHWHSELYKDKNYHLNKTKECENKNIRLIHIFEDEWNYKKDIVKSMITNLISKNEKRIFARKCEIITISSKESNIFLEENHIQGKCKSSINYGLKYNNELVALMTFGKTRQQKKYNKDYENTWEMYRFCNKLNTTVVGGASRILKHFINELQPHKIITYADKRWSIGKLYKTLGFTHTHDSKPNYFYVFDDKRKNRFNFRKCNLVKEGYDINKSESEIMKERKIYRIYDCGAMVFEMTF